MGVFEHFPYTNIHNLNLDWILELIKKFDADNTALNQWKDQHEIDYEELAEKVDGIIGNLVEIITPWDSSIAYQIYSIVEYQGTNYIAIQNVPVGAMITDTDYWTPANTVVEQINAIGAQTTEIERDAKHYYLRPQDFGAVGDGVTDDTGAFVAMVAEVNSLIARKTFTDVNPSEWIGGIEVYIPAGNYVLTESFKVPSGIVVRGAGINATILQFSGGYGISLDGKPYNNLKYWTGRISDLRINMGGGGTGLSNAELCNMTADGQNAVHHSTFERIQISNAHAGFAMIGGWLNRIEECTVTACNYGYILTRLTGINGNNANSIHNCAALSMKACGFWFDSTGLLVDGCNAESIGNTWQGTYTGESITLAGEQISVDNPCGVYCGNSTRGTFKRCWFERITSVGATLTYGFLINTAAPGGVPSNGGIIIESPMFNSDVWNPIRCAIAAILKVTNPYWTYISGSSGNFISLTECVFGSYFIDMIDYSLAQYIAADTPSQYNRIYINNVSMYGSNSLLEKYGSYTNGTNNAIFGKEFFKGENGNDLTKVSRVQSNISDVADFYNNEALEIYHYKANEQCVKFPKNSRVVTLAANSHTMTIPFGQPGHSTGNAAGVLLAARSAAGAALIAAGYYWSTQSESDHTITVYFTNTNSAAQTFDAFVFRQA